MKDTKMLVSKLNTEIIKSYDVIPHTTIVTSSFYSLNSKYLKWGVILGMGIFPQKMSVFVYHFERQKKEYISHVKGVFSDRLYQYKIPNFDRLFDFTKSRLNKQQK